MARLTDKIAVITGGNSGIGLATAKRFVQEGAYVFITGRRQAELDAAVSLIGKNVTAVQGDVSKLDDLDHSTRWCEEKRDVSMSSSQMPALWTLFHSQNRRQKRSTSTSI